MGISPNTKAILGQKLGLHAKATLKPEKEIEGMNNNESRESEYHEKRDRA